MYMPPHHHTAGGREGGGGGEAAPGHKLYTECSRLSTGVVATFLYSAELLSPIVSASARWSPTHDHTYRDVDID